MLFTCVINANYLHFQNKSTYFALDQTIREPRISLHDKREGHTAGRNCLELHNDRTHLSNRNSTYTLIILTGGPPG